MPSPSRPDRGDRENTTDIRGETGADRRHTLPAEDRGAITIPTKEKWRGRLFLAEGRGLFLGSVQRTELHAHHAVQVTFALDGEFGLRCGESESWRNYGAATIAADQPHQLDGYGNTLAVLYLDPEAAGNRSFAQVSHQSGVCPVPGFILRPARTQLVHAWEKNDTAERIPALCHRLAQLLAGASPWGAIDPRVRRAVNMMRTAPRKRAGLVELSTAVAISPSRLAHLFREQTGLPIRRYLLWLRLGDAVQKIGQGSSLSEAAHAAGFSDSAHLSRTFRRMFGITPSALRVNAAG